MEGLSEKEKRQLIIDVAVRISPVVIEKNKGSDDASDLVAIYAYHIADAVNSILTDPSGSGL